MSSWWAFPAPAPRWWSRRWPAIREVRAMEEIDCLAEAAGRFFYAENGLEEFAQLSDAELDALRDRYWQAVDASGALRDRAVFVDKLPLNSVHQGFIAKLFPNAKILFALRDPRDVVLSCFRRRLVLTSATPGAVAAGWRGRLL